MTWTSTGNATAVPTGAVWAFVVGSALTVNWVLGPVVESFLLHAPSMVAIAASVAMLAIRGDENILVMLVLLSEVSELVDSPACAV
jgi:hypothetical protein